MKYQNFVKVMKWDRLTRNHRFLQIIRTLYIPSLWLKHFYHRNLVDMFCFYDYDKSAYFKGRLVKCNYARLAIV